ncbi:alpha/beta hydrolase [Hamadaea sp. NPDC050747]|uniref:alpha/beta fold hydrolase n=1 Tax=Hamadaea sp. NPDC050747 TaxID=3155789 RepID=UPI0033E42F35
MITRTTTAPDGATLGWYSIGSGPGLLILHGAMESAVSHRELAEALSDQFTVHLLDRRGRGLSGPYPAPGVPQSEVDDVRAVLAATETSQVFGVSSGAIVALEAAAFVKKAAIFEPPIFSSAAVPAAALARLDASLAAGEVVDALVTGMLAAEMGPAFLRRVPRPVLRSLTALGVRADARRAGVDGHVPMGELGRLLHYDFALSAQASGQFDRYAGITAEVLLLNGTRSPAYLRESVASLARVLPSARHVQLDGLDHGASGNADRRGKPGVVASVLRDFFG